MFDTDSFPKIQNKLIDNPFLSVRKVGAKKGKKKGGKRGKR